MTVLLVPAEGIDLKTLWSLQCFLLQNNGTHVYFSQEDLCSLDESSDHQEHSVFQPVLEEEPVTCTGSRDQKPSLSDEHPLAITGAEHTLIWADHCKKQAWMC